MKKTIIIKDFEFETIIGILDFERITPQKVRVNLEFSSSCFIDYVEVIEFLKRNFDECKFDTLENALEILSKKLKDKFENLLDLKLEIFKPNIVKNAVVGARLEKNF